jgi:molybdopterin converting factor small subunit
VSVEIQLSSIFGRFTDNKLTFQVEGKTVGECLKELFKQYPKLEGLLLNREGELQRAYDVYINGESAYPKEMKKKVKDGDKLNIVFIIYGG